MKYRTWQLQAAGKAKKWFAKGNRTFALTVATATGKTVAASLIAHQLLQSGEIDRVVVIAPRRNIVSQWRKTFADITGLSMGKITGSDLDDIDIHFAATWHALSGIQDAMQMMCASSRVLVICDEVHHTPVEAVWGKSAHGAFATAKHAILLSATPYRSDGAQIVWCDYQDGQIEFPVEAVYSMTYGEAVEHKYCRPASFHLHDGEFSVEVEKGISVSVSADKTVRLPEEFSAIPGLAEKLEFLRLIKIPEYDSFGQPNTNGFHASMLRWGIFKLGLLRKQMPNAGGLIIAPSIEMASYFAELLFLLDGERPVVVTTNTPDAEQVIDNFTTSQKKWLISVDMISEGVDIPRLRVLVYLSRSSTELSFRQAIGRVIRNWSDIDDTRAYVIMPKNSIFSEYAARVEAEMPAIYRDKELYKEICEHGDTHASINTSYRICPDCFAMNHTSVRDCHYCGNQLIFTPYSISLRSALRQGVISRGNKLSEAEVQNAELIAEEFRDYIYSTGDDKLCDILRKSTDELTIRLKRELSL